MNLIVDHVLETLVVGGAKEDLGVQFTSCVAIIEDFVPSQVVAILIEELRDFLNIDSIVERSGVTYLSLVG